ncbi:unnamed protein product, partial [Pylaiella littoralis]
RRRSWSSCGRHCSCGQASGESGAPTRTWNEGDWNRKSWGKCPGGESGCGCHRRGGYGRVSHSLAMTPSRCVEPWSELIIDLLAIDVESQSQNKYVLLVVDNATKFPFGFSSPSKQAIGVARKLVELCLTFGVPHTIRCDGGSE